MSFSNCWEFHHIFLSVKLPWGLAWEDRNKVEFLCFFVDYIVKSLFIATWTISKFNRITLISFEEFPKFSRDCGWLNLIWVDQWIKNSLCSMYWVCDDNNVINVDYLGGLINAISDSKKFGLSGSDIDCMIESLDNGIIMDMNMSNWSGYLIFDAYI